MLRHSTKDTYEHEQDEAERLVRPMPKVKPPRRDLRRNQVDSKDDPDQKVEKEAASRVLARFLRVSGDDELIEAWSKKEKRKVRVMPDTLKEKPDEYEAYEGQEEIEAGATPTKAQPVEPLSEKENTKEVSKSEKEVSKGPESKSPSKQSFPETEEWVFKGGPSNEAFKAFADKDKKVSSDSEGHLLFVNPKGKGSKKKVLFEDLPPEVQADWHGKFLEDVHHQENLTKLMNASLSEDTKSILSDLVNPNTALGKKVKALDSKDLADLDIVKSFPELKGHVPEGFHNLGDLVEAATKAFPPPPPPPRRAVTPEERKETWQYIQDELPAGMAASLEDLHPDDIKKFVKDFQAAQEKPPSMEDLLGSVQGNFCTDIDKVPDPPVEELNGLSPEKKAEAIQQHSLKVLTQSLIARERLSEKYMSSGLPYAVSRKMAVAQLSNKPGDVPEHVTDKQADEVFDSVLTSGSPTQISSRQVAEAFSTVKDDPRLAKLITAFMQGNDYWLAKEKFLSAGSEDAFNERHDPKRIAKGIIKANRFLADRAKQYPSEAQRHDTATAFRVRVMEKLKTLDPEKYEAVRETLRAEEDAEFRKADAQYKQLSKEHETEYQKWLKDKKRWDKWHKKPLEPFTMGKAPPKEPGEEPKKPDRPKPPLGYVPQDATDEELEAHKSLWRNKQAQAVVRRFRGINMTHRNAVYTGIAPYKNAPMYPEWEQGSQRALTEKDFSTVLAEAKKWAKTPVLAKGFVGIPKDAQLRAALDLAIQSCENGKYSEVFTAPEYEKLLRDLAGVPENGTLMTIQSRQDSSYTNASGDSRVLTLDREVHMSMPKFSSQQADQILSRLDKLAHTIQERHASWGMPFEVAKDIVNNLDRTADEIEVASFGKESFMKRQAEVIQRDSDETYMDTFQNPQAPIQVDADEPYMAEYKVDQSSDVNHGKSTTGRPLAP